MSIIAAMRSVGWMNSLPFMRGVAARALEQKGIISDRCELNRQIKVDNALLRELKLLVKKLMDAVKNTVPAIAEAMEIVWQKMIVFRYHLLHIGARKKNLTSTLKVVKPDPRRYENIVNQLKGKIRERRTLLEEKKTIPAIQVFRQRELAQKIAGLTEDIEELKSEKVLLLNQLNCADDHGMTEIKRRITSMENSLNQYRAEGVSALSENGNAQRRRYSEEIRQKAVEEYLSGQGSAMAIAEKYKLRSGNLVLDWAEEYHRHRNSVEATGGVSMAKRKHTQEERVQAVREYLEEECGFF